MLYPLPTAKPGVFLKSKSKGRASRRCDSCKSLVRANLHVLQGASLHHSLGESVVQKRGVCRIGTPLCRTVQMCAVLVHNMDCARDASIRLS